jgi:hypothetical protein
LAGGSPGRTPLTATGPVGPAITGLAARRAAMSWMVFIVREETTNGMLLFSKEGATTLEYNGRPAENLKAERIVKKVKKGNTKYYPVI